ncbi:PREDICTED: F-box only protein 16 [Sturnus vulgaris]|uniref:F-box only protein 16 n=1 Tax=Sturnus vulgaris TaxID=9172 RepID=UPI00071A8C07|nr:PREDICTED: F-box only protein 16 [Sturnus vulgaris]
MRMGGRRRRELIGWPRLLLRGCHSDGMRMGGGGRGGGNVRRREEEGLVLGMVKQRLAQFDKWTDGQRRRILLDLLERCSLSQQKFCAKQLQARVPIEAVDFTTRLPRVLSLYIFSFLDPRSLCRCAQVSWHWKYLSELDQLWMLKCLRFGWLINFCPTPFEQGVWKNHYLDKVKELRLSAAKTPSKDEFIVIDVQPVKIKIPERKHPLAAQGTSRGKKEIPPWRSSDRNPTDTVRYNYLDNEHPIEQARQGRRKGGGHTPDLSRQEAERKKRGGRGSAQLRKVKSLLSVPADPDPVPKPPVRPSWVCPGQPEPEAPARSSRGSQSSQAPPLFEAQPWPIPSSNQGSDTE